MLTKGFILFILKVTFVFPFLIFGLFLIIKLIQKKESRNIPFLIFGSAIFISGMMWFDYTSFGNPLFFQTFVVFVLKETQL